MSNEAIAKSLMLLSTEYEFELTGDRIKIWMSALQPYGADLVKRGVEAFMLDPIAGRFKPKLADIIGKCQMAQGGDGRPGDGEAWAIALQARDEAATVIINPEILAAWGSARAVYDDGDDTGARMAFRDAYTRIVQQARVSGKPVTWHASLGTDSAQRESVVKAAVNAGLIEFDKKDVLLLGTDKGQAITPDKHAENMARLRAELEKLEDPFEKLANAAHERAQTERSRIAAAKNQTREKFIQYGAST
ncbi:MAG: hypothetical protein V4447_10805 [Pseudomonadota bacterium]